jgi:CRP-like cAMP-binding protein
VSLTFESILSPGAMVGHLSYGLLIVSMLMTRIVWLRVFAIGSGVVGLTYDVFWLFDPVGVFWESAFVLTNLAQIALLAYRNRLARFTAEERAFYEIAVPELEPTQARRLIGLGRWRDCEPGGVLTRSGEAVADLVFLTEGAVDIEVDGHVVAECSAGSFVGEISVSTGGPASATATVREKVRCLAFDGAVVRREFDRGTDVGRALEAAFRQGLREKLVRTNETMAALQRAAVS